MDKSCCWPPLSEVIRLVVHAQEDAGQRLPLLKRAFSALDRQADILAAERETLAEQLERWRYLSLQRYWDRGNRGHTGRQQRMLIDFLDRLASAVLRQPAHPPKHPRLAVSGQWPGPCGTGPAAQQDDRFEQALDTATPLETVVEWARATTLGHFGEHASGCLSAARATDEQGTHRAAHGMLLYAPLYLSNYCINHCLYCHFRYPHKLRRVHLDQDAALAQAEYLRQRGFRRLLLVAGDYPRLTSTDYFVQVVRACVDRGFEVAVEIAPQSTVGYARLVRAGATGVTLYQETYQEDAFARLHPRGTKHGFDWRLEGPERAAEAGITHLGLGILVGLGPAAAEIRALVEHGRYLRRRFAHLRLAFSLPRLHEAPDGFVTPYPVDDDTLIRLYCALRLAFPQAELVLSTRERPALRNRLATICITQMSAESCTSPGGYGQARAEVDERQQFPVADERTAAEISAWLQGVGCEVYWSS